MKYKFIRILSLILACILSAACLFAACSHGDGGSDGGSGTPPEENRPGLPEEPEGDGYPSELFSSGMYSPSKVGMSAEYLGTAERRLPAVSDGGLSRYPAYGVDFSGTEEEKQAILDENTALNASDSTYDSMDEAGNLYRNGEPTGGKLYKHTASAGMYGGDVSDSEPALVKRLSIRSRSGGNHITGLYAPAGEVVRIEMSEEDFARTGGLKVSIGQVLTNGSQNNIWLARTFNRMPMIANVMTTPSATAYVGSYLGGPIYVQPVKAGVPFTVTIAGGVAYSHFILGYTTREEFERNKNSTAPYFDLEVWEDSVRHSGPKSRAEQFDYDELTEAAILWDKIARVSNQVPAGSGGDLGITFLYDPFIAAGSMVAFVGRHTVNCPPVCLTAALDADSAVDNASDNFWGCIHEFNHHYQRYGFHPGDEVTNNAVSLVEYSLFTRISANRALGSAGEGLSGWNRYTNPGWVLKQTVSAAQGGSENSALDSYANLLYAFGQDAFIRMARGGNGSGGADVWYRAVSDASEYNMTYYFRDLLHQTVSPSVLSEYAGKGYPVFVPVASIYQTGRSYLRGGKKYYSRTAQPYGIETGEDFELNFNENIVLPEGFSYTIKNVGEPQYGTLAKKSDGVYVYTPDKANRESGRIVVTLGIEKADGAFEVEDVDLVVELRQKQKTPTMLERTVYTYAPESMPASAAEAYESGYAGHETATEEDNANRVQHGNAEIWEPNPTNNAVMEIRGKFEAPADGKYRVALRGRDNAALYISPDGKNYERAAVIENASGGDSFELNDKNHYTDVELKKGQWVHFKAVLLVTNGRCFIGVGLGRFSGENVQVSYLNAYRSSYEREPFESDYFYRREYSYDYAETPAEQSLVETNYRPWDESYDISNLFDEDDTNFIHSDKTLYVTAQNPFELTVDLGKAMRANRFTVYGEPSRRYQPKNFRLYGGSDPENLELIAEVQNSERINDNVIVGFEERELRYYKIVVTDTWAEGPKYIAFRRAEMSYAVPGAVQLSPDESMFSYRGNWKISNEGLSTFGHRYEGENAVLEFTFTGTRFGILSRISEEYGAFEVLIDGAAAENFAAASEGQSVGVSFLSGELAAGEHTVAVRSKQKFNVDSVLLWQ